MTHFIVGVIVPKKEIEFAEDYIDKTLEKYSEEYKVELYPEKTRAELDEEFEDWKREREDKIKNGKKIEDYELAYFTEDKKQLKEIPVKDWAKSWLGCDKFDKDGNALTTRNPNSFYDYYSIGGRWSGLFYEKRKDEDNILEDNKILVKDLIKKYKKAEGNTKEKILKSLSNEEEDNPYLIYVIVADGKVHQGRNAGWFGTYNKTKEEKEWKKEYLKLLEAHKDDFMINLDCHI